MLGSRPHAADAGVCYKQQVTLAAVTGLDRASRARKARKALGANGNKADESQVKGPRSDDLCPCLQMWSEESPQQGSA